MGVESQIYNFDQVSISPGKDITRMLILKFTYLLTFRNIIFANFILYTFKFFTNATLLGPLLCDVRGLFQKYELAWCRKNWIWMLIQVNIYEIIVNIFSLLKAINCSVIVPKFTRIYTGCSTYDLTEQFM